MKLYPIHAGNFKLDGGAMFGVVPKTLWQKQYPSDENNLCNWALRCLLVVDGNRKILIDAGIGEKQDAKYLGHFHLNGSYTLQKSLNEAGFAFKDITDVILTHLHFDHCGGAVKWNNSKTGFEPTFPVANYWVSRSQFDWAINPNDREKPSYPKENIMPLMESGRLKFITQDGEIFPNVEVRIFDGHTRGQLIPYINFHGRIVAFMGDLLPSTAHILLPYIMAYDVDPLRTLEEKKQFLKEAAENDYILFFEHDAYHECATVIETEKGIRVKATFDLNNFDNPTS